MQMAIITLAIWRHMATISYECDSYYVSFFVWLIAERSRGHHSKQNLPRIHQTLCACNPEAAGGQRVGNSVR